MGDRALIVFTSKDDISPTVYLHNLGYNVAQLIAELKKLMQGREGDVSYAAARLIGLAHERTPGNLSVGVFETPEWIRAAIKYIDTPTAKQELETYSHGDAGVIVVDTDNDFIWRAYGGYWN